MLSAGEQIGKYKILSAIGAGGMGEVYLAEDTQLKRSVALKLLPFEHIQNENKLRRFVQEAYAAAALNHPNIAHIYEIGEHEGTNFIAMEFVEGVTLREKIHHEKNDLRTLLKYLGQVAEGLAKAHGARIVHRDLKPDNIMISSDGYAKILDFGLAKLIDAKLLNGQEANSESATAMLPQQLSTPGMIMGTIGYMSPEQARGGKEIDQRSDIFSFGCILYEAATRHQPFAGETVIDSLHKIIHAQPRLIKDFNQQAPADLQRIVRRCLQKDPEERFQTIKDVAIELKELRLQMKNEAVNRDSISPKKTPDLTVSKFENPTLIVGDTTAPEPVMHSTSSAKHLVNRIGQPKKATAFIAFAMIALGTGLIFGLYKFYSSRQSSSAATPVKVTPLASSPNVERSPALSRDGKQIAYVWTGEKGDNFDIYVKITDAGAPVRLTSDPEREMSPSWSPDGRFIAFMRGRGEKKGFYIIPALGGAERKIADAFEWNQAGVRSQAIDWSPDGNTLAVIDKTSESEPWSVFLVSVETGEKRKLTTPPAQTNGDILLAFSPDGKSLAFTRTNAQNGNIFIVPVAGGEPSQLTFDDASNFSGVDWMSDGEHLVFSSETAGRLALWIIPASGGVPTQAAGMGENALDLSFSPQSNRLVYAQISVDVNLWRIEISDPANGEHQNTNAPTKIISSTRLEEHPQYSPNGEKIAFKSNRSGSTEIWVSDSNGQNALQLTNFGGSFPKDPRWSPDGRFIAFDLSVSGNADIYITSAEGGTPRRLTTDVTDEIEPSWSKDGRYIYFSSNRTGRNEIWKMLVTGAEAVQITREGGLISSESSDGTVLYFTKVRSEEGLWSVSTEGGAETKVLDYRVGRNFAVSEQGIYFFSYTQAGRAPYTIEFFDFAKRQTTRLATLSELAGPYVVTGITVSPDQRFIVYGQRDKLDFDLMLVENFR